MRKISSSRSIISSQRMSRCRNKISSSRSISSQSRSSSSSNNKNSRSSSGFIHPYNQMYILTFDIGIVIS